MGRNGGCSRGTECRFDTAKTAAPGREPKAAAVRTRAMEVLAHTLLAFDRPEPAWSMRRQHAHLSDEALVALVARGDEPALAELYDRVGRVAYGLALRIVRDERLAEDAVQEGFLAVWRTAASFRAERAKASTWILTLVHRRSVDLVRREERRRAEPLPEEIPVRAGESGTPTDEAAWLRYERERVQIGRAHV